MKKQVAILLGFIALTTLSLQAQESSEQIPAWKRLQDEVVPMPESYENRVRRAGNLLEMSLDDAIQMALANNLQIAIEDFNESITQEQIIETRGFYDPSIRFQLGWDSSETPSTTILDAGVGVPTRVSKSWFLNTTLLQNVPGGGQFQLAFNNSRSTTNSAFSTVNPLFGSIFRLSYRQPLWKGFRETQTERQIKLFNLDSQIDQSVFEQRVAEIIQRVENQYWELIFAIQNYEAQRESVELAIIQFENNKKRSRIGALAPIEITTSRAEVASREQNWVQSEVQIITAENGLKTLIAPDPNDSLWQLTILPTDTPEMEDLTLDLDEAVRTALSGRPELDQLNLRLERTAVDRKYLRREGKPTVDLVASVTSRGTAGEVFRDVRADTDGDGVPDQVIGREPATDSPLFGNFSDTFSQAFGYDFISYNFSVDVEIPLRNRSNEARLAQAGLQERQLRHQIKDTQQNILAEVRNAYQSIETQKKRVEIAELTRNLTEEQLAGENKRFQAGLSTNFEVLRFQRDLTNARVRELRALVDYRQALTALRKAMYTILDGTDMEIAHREGN